MRGDALAEIDPRLARKLLLQALAELSPGSREGLNPRSGDVIAKGIEVAVAGEDSSVGMFEAEAAVLVEPATHSAAAGAEGGPLVGEEEEIINVTQVARNFQVMFHLVIEGGQIDVGGEKLAGVRANGQAATGWRPVGGEAGAGAEGRVVVKTGSDFEYMIDYREEGTVANLAAEEPAEDAEVDAWEIVLDVEVQGIGVAALEFL